MRISMFLFLMIFSLSIFGQNSIQFVVCNEAKNPISYATVLSIKSQKGAYSDLNGKVKLTELLLDDSITVSCVGFQKMNLSLAKISDTVFLQTSIRELDEFVVKSVYEREVIGIQRKNFIHSHSVGRYAGIIEGIVFPDVKKSFLESVSIYIEQPEDSSRIQFLLMIYEVDDSSDLPTSPILTKQLFFDMTKEGWSEINLDSLHIQVSGKFFIGIESVPNYAFDDAPEYYKWTDKPYATYKGGSFMAKKLDLTSVSCIAGIRTNVSMEGEIIGAHNIFPLIKATIKY